MNFAAKSLVPKKFDDKKLKLHLAPTWIDFEKLLKDEIGGSEGLSRREQEAAENAFIRKHVFPILEINGVWSAAEASCGRATMRIAIKPISGDKGLQTILMFTKHKDMVRFRKAYEQIARPEVKGAFETDLALTESIVHTQSLNP